jgi:hypothetical protein
MVWNVNRSARIGVLLTTVLGCASTDAPGPPPAQAIERVPVRRFDAPVPVPHQLRVSVRAVSAADVQFVDELRAMTQRFVGMGLGVSGAGIAEVALMPGSLFAGGVIMGAVILVPMVIGIDLVERGQSETIKKVIAQSDLVRMIADDLTPRIPAPVPSTALPEVDVEVVVLGYGLVPRSATSTALCLMADAALRVKVADVEVFQAPVYIEPLRRSADAPPPICASMAEFAKDDGERLASAIGDYSRVLGAITVHRLQGLSWRG